MAKKKKKKKIKKGAPTRGARTTGLRPVSLKKKSSAKTNLRPVSPAKKSSVKTDLRSVSLKKSKIPKKLDHPINPLVKPEEGDDNNNVKSPDQVGGSDDGTSIIIRIKTYYINNKKSIEEYFLMVVIIFLVLLNILLFWSINRENQLKTQKNEQIQLDREKKEAIQRENRLKNQQLVVNKQEKSEDVLINTDSWSLYTNKVYGFELKYPPEWKMPIVKRAMRGAKWDQSYSFRKKEITEDNPYIGFDVLIYRVSKVKELTNTDELSALKKKEMAKSDICTDLEGHLISNENYVAEQVYIPAADDCYNPDFFFTLTRNEYIYNIVSIAKPGYRKTDDPKEEVKKYSAEYFAVVANLNLIEIERPKIATPATPSVVKPVAPKPKSKPSAPMPVSAKKSGGRLVCAKKNDHPSMSLQHSKKHMDMECCLDPDEYPNPNCDYSGNSKYDKYL